MTETAKFALELEDGISSSSESAEDALKSLQTQIDKDTKSLSEMKKAMRQMQAGGSVDVSAYKKLKSEIDSTQESIGKARASFINLGGDFSKIKKQKNPFPKPQKPTELKEMLSATSALPGPLSKASKGVSGLQAVVTGLTGALGLTLAAVAAVVAVIAVMVAGLIAVTVATAKATVELLKYAAAQSDAMRSERLRLEGLGTLRRWMRLTAKDSAQMNESINRVSERVPLARSEIAGLGQELHRIGIRGRAAEDALEALSLAQAVQGDLGRQRLMMLVRQAGHSEGAMRDLAARVQRELGGIAARQMMSLTMISTKLRESFQALFTGVNLAPLTSGIYRLSRLLSQSTESGRALKAIFTNVLSAILGPLEGTISPIEYLLKEIIILALKGAIIFFMLKNRIEKTFGSDIIARILKTALSMKNIKIAFTALLVVVGLIGAAFVFLGFVLIGLAVPFIGIALAIHKAYENFQTFYKFVESVHNMMRTMSWGEIGQSIIDGIVKGLTGGIGRLRAGMTTVADVARTTFQNVLGIRSPSQVFARFGLAIPQGITAGIERGESQANQAVGNLISTVSAPNNINNNTNQSRSINIEAININLGPNNNEDTAEEVKNALQDFFLNSLATEV